MGQKNSNNFNIANINTYSKFFSQLMLRYYYLEKSNLSQEEKIIQKKELDEILLKIYEKIKKEYEKISPDTSFEKIIEDWLYSIPTLDQNSKETLSTLDKFRIAWNKYYINFKKTEKQHFPTIYGFLPKITNNKIPFYNIVEIFQELEGKDKNIYNSLEKIPFYPRKDQQKKGYTERGYNSRYSGQAPKSTHNNNPTYYPQQNNSLTDKQIDTFIFNHFILLLKLDKKGLYKDIVKQLEKKHGKVIDLNDFYEIVENLQGNESLKNIQKKLKELFEESDYILYTKKPNETKEEAQKRRTKEKEEFNKKLQKIFKDDEKLLKLFYDEIRKKIQAPDIENITNIANEIPDLIKFDKRAIIEKMLEGTEYGFENDNSNYIYKLDDNGNKIGSPAADLKENNKGELFLSFFSNNLKTIIPPEIVNNNVSLLDYILNSNMEIELAEQNNPIIKDILGVFEDKIDLSGTYSRASIKNKEKEREFKILLNSLTKKYKKHLSDDSFLRDIEVLTKLWGDNKDPRIILTIFNSALINRSLNGEYYFIAKILEEYFENKTDQSKTVESFFKKTNLEDVYKELYIESDTQAIKDEKITSIYKIYKNISFLQVLSYLDDIKETIEFKNEKLNSIEDITLEKLEEYVSIDSDGTIKNLKNLDKTIFDKILYVYKVLKREPEFVSNNKELYNKLQKTNLKGFFNGLKTSKGIHLEYLGKYKDILKAIGIDIPDFIPSSENYFYQFKTFKKILEEKEEEKDSIFSLLNEVFVILKYKNDEKKLKELESYIDQNFIAKILLNKELLELEKYHNDFLSFMKEPLKDINKIFNIVKKIQIETNKEQQQTNKKNILIDKLENGIKELLSILIRNEILKIPDIEKEEFKDSFKETFRTIFEFDKNLSDEEKDKEIEKHFEIFKGIITEKEEAIKRFLEKKPEFKEHSNNSYDDFKTNIEKYKTGKDVLGGILEEFLKETSKTLKYKEEYTNGGAIEKFKEILNVDTSTKKDRKNVFNDKLKELKKDIHEPTQKISNLKNEEDTTKYIFNQDKDNNNIETELFRFMSIVEKNLDNEEFPKFLKNLFVKDFDNGILLYLKTSQHIKGGQEKQIFEKYFPQEEFSFLYKDGYTQSKELFEGISIQGSKLNASFYYYFIEQLNKTYEQYQTIGFDRIEKLILTKYQGVIKNTIENIENKIKKLEEEIKTNPELQNKLSIQYQMLDLFKNAKKQQNVIDIRKVFNNNEKILEKVEGEIKKELEPYVLLDIYLFAKNLKETSKTTIFEKINSFLKKYKDENGNIDPTKLNFISFPKELKVIFFKALESQEKLYTDNFLNDVSNFDVIPYLKPQKTSKTSEKIFLNTKLTNTKNMFKEDIKRKMIGIAPAPVAVTISYGLYDGLIHAYDQTIQSSKMIFQGVQKLLQGIVPHSEVGGVISIGKVISDASNTGIVSLFLIAALISVNLGVLNLLPIPALDGGHIMFNLYEMITKRKPNQKVLIQLTIMGWIILLGLMVLGLYNDINRFFTN